MQIKIFNEINTEINEPFTHIFLPHSFIFGIILHLEELGKIEPGNKMCKIITTLLLRVGDRLMIYLLDQGLVFTK